MRDETGVPNQGNWNKVAKDKKAGIRLVVSKKIGYYNHSFGNYSDLDNPEQIHLYFSLKIPLLVIS